MHATNPNTTAVEKDGPQVVLTLAEKHVALIASRCIFWWRFLPASVKIWYDVDDMIGGAVLHVVKRSTKYDASKAKESTWIHHVTDNFCMSQLAHWKSHKYSDCETVELDEDASRKIKATSSLEMRESRAAVERLIEIASDAVRDFLDKVFNGGVITEVPAWELREAARCAGANLSDIERVYRACVS